MTILVIHGPNLNLLGTREPEIYGKKTLKEIDALIVAHGRKLGVEIRTAQSNHEGVIIDLIQTAAGDGISAIVLNPGAYSHTSVAIADAIRSVKTPVVEVHLTNVFARGGDRVKLVTATSAKGAILGFGFESYLLGVEAAVRVVGSSRSRKHTGLTVKRARSGRTR
ncbi:MAG TPA: type II 3-dehydroquinate dehydratase [Candidatus Krumholzibacteria bacterium]|nr:type II 3-dehydroquinate dehydratase [Candidatus Krumholzibacteria bacterium]